MRDIEYASADRLIEALRAEELLCRMELVEDLGVGFETETNQLLRDQYAAWYREAIGVRPERRMALREELDRVIQVGDPPVAHVVQELSDHVSSKSSSTA